ncbi:MAG: ChaN family lipoprotein [Thermoleophilia bacterium]|nr:ChaN family lipoprotein [Thermoleophilia bacterium]
MNAHGRGWMAGLCIAAAAALALLGGCASPGIPREVIPPAEAVSRIRIFTGDGDAADWEAVKRAAWQADAVILAEQHGHPLGLSTAAALWREILAAAYRQSAAQSLTPLGLLGLADAPSGRREARPALCLEFFERDQAADLAAYQRGEITEAEFLTRTGKSAALSPDTKNPWETGYPPGHRDMVNAAIAADAPVYAANAPRRLVRLARTEGYDAIEKLSATDRLTVALPRFAKDPAPPDNRSWRDFLDFMGTTPEKYAAATPEEKEKADGMFRAQSVWDATMADTVLREVSRGRRPVALVVGQFHADYAKLGGGGTVLAIKAARPETRVVVASFQDADPNGAFREEDKDRADFIIYCGKRPASPSAGKD